MTYTSLFFILLYSLLLSKRTWQLCCAERLHYINVSIIEDNNGTYVNEEGFTYQSATFARISRCTYGCPFPRDIHVLPKSVDDAMLYAYLCARRPKLMQKPSMNDFPNRTRVRSHRMPHTIALTVARHVLPVLRADLIRHTFFIWLQCLLL